MKGEGLIVIIIIFVTMFTVLDLSGLIPWTLMMPANMNTVGYFAPFVSLAITFLLIGVMVGVIFWIARKVTHG